MSAAITVSQRSHPMLEQEMVALVMSSIPKPPEARSPEEVQAHDEFSRICELIIRATVRRVYQTPNGEADRDDLAQEVWALLMCALPEWQFDPTAGTLHGWVASVALHEAWKRARGYAKHHANTLPLETVEELLCADIGGLCEIERTERQEEASDALCELERRMSPLNNQIFRMHCCDGKSVPQIANEIGRSVDCVRMRFRRAKSVLAEILLQHGPGRPH
jgi:RNA polymerase sigma factor (sigma-70 family)